MSPSKNTEHPWFLPVNRGKHLGDRPPRLFGGFSKGLLKRWEKGDLDVGLFQQEKWHMWDNTLNIFKHHADYRIWAKPDLYRSRMDDCDVTSLEMGKFSCCFLAAFYTNAVLHVSGGWWLQIKHDQTMQCFLRILFLLVGGAVSSTWQCKLVESKSLPWNHFSFSFSNS